MTICRFCQEEIYVFDDFICPNRATTARYPDGKPHEPDICGQRFWDEPCLLPPGHPGEHDVDPQE